MSELTGQVEKAIEAASDPGRQHKALAVFREHGPAILAAVKAMERADQFDTVTSNSEMSDLSASYVLNDVLGLAAYRSAIRAGKEAE